MKFNNITLAGTNKSGARTGEGLGRLENHYVQDSGWAIGTTANDTVNTDYYAIWNTWPTMSGASTRNIAPIDVSGTPLSDIGITTLTIKSKNAYNAGSDVLDMAIVRKSDRRAVSITFPASATSDLDILSAGYVPAGQAQIKTISPNQGPWSPEIGRLLNQGQI